MQPCWRSCSFLPFLDYCPARTWGPRAQIVFLKELGLDHLGKWQVSVDRHIAVMREELEKIHADNGWLLAIAIFALILAATSLVLTFFGD